jgi:hypothetical protein
MIHSFFKKIKSISKISFRFDTPKKYKLLLFDEIHLSVANKLFKKNFNILETRNKKIYFWIYLKQIIFFDFISYVSIFVFVISLPYNSFNMALTMVYLPFPEEPYIKKFGILFLLFINRCFITLISLFKNDLGINNGK